ncbi:MAG TPA: Do family serine endopeptidase [bacterium]|nr:Do family serine endopeptidase [bacterium]HPS29043.1 Do family serine endopeptidase [bacterium]
MKYLRLIAVVIVTLSFFTPFLNATDIQSLEKEIIQISEKAKKSVAAIKTERKAQGSYQDPFFDFLRQFGFRGNPQPYNPKREAMGTGFVIDDVEGYVVTNNHVIDGADKIEVNINEKKYKGKLIGTDPQTDIGLVKIEGFKKGDISALAFADSNEIKVGSFAIAIGNPFGLSHTVTFGIVSAKGRAGMNVTEYEDFIQTDAAINPGNSGGPLMNISGQVMGMNTAIFSQSGGYMGIGFAVPSNMIKEITGQLRAGKKIQRALMGVTIQDLNDDLREYLKLDKSIDGVLISSVGKDSPAEKAGISSGDVIVNFNRKPTESVARLKNAVGFSPLKQKLPVELYRNGKKMTLHVILDDGFQSAEVDAVSGNKIAGEIGMTLAVEKDFVVVSSVERDSLAFMAGIMEGDVIVAVNKNRVKTIAEVVNTIAKSKSVLFLINRQGKEFFVVVNR